MNSKVLKADVLLLITALIWGFAFTAQKTGMNYVGPFTYNALRYLLGSVVLIPLLIFTKMKHNDYGKTKDLIFYSGLAACVMFIAVSLQQFAMAGTTWTTATTVGNCGFITGFYVILIPIAGIFLGRKTGIPTWIGALFAIVGLFFVSGVAKGVIENKGVSINGGDALTGISALFWTCHVILIDRAVQKVNPAFFSVGQFFFCGILNIIFGILNITAAITAAAGIKVGHEIFSADFSFGKILEGWIPVLYGGLGSVGIAYTLQAFAQQTAPPAHAAIILCLETLFAAIGGIILLGESPTGWTILGFALMLAGMLTTQWDLISNKRAEAENK